ncbi:MAG TPA: type IV pili twitching motility protein PilT, partial [Nitrospiria bacterium]|nr:type IV pili twitching motility protein PilT [Nitrospiria bacterium]
MDINDLLKSASERKASDLHFKVGNPPIVRVDGKLQAMDQYPKIAQEDVVALAFSVMNTGQKQRFKDHNEVDLAYSAPGLGRFRVNIYQQRGSIGMVCRVIPTKILTISDLNLPAVVEKLAGEQRGLILVT